VGESRLRAREGGGREQGGDKPGRRDAPRRPTPLVPVEQGGEGDEPGRRDAPRQPTPLTSVEQGGIEVAAAESSPGATASRWGCVPREVGSGDGGPKEQGRGLRCRRASGR
jgi:hypothetical protein